jgi:hypothetical protein
MPEAPPPFAENPKDKLPHLISGDKKFAEKEARCHYRYASGRVLPKPLIAGVYSMAYYTPGVLELFEALIDPSKTDQEARPWPMPVVAKNIGKTYAKLAASLLQTGAVPLGVLRVNGPLPYVLSCTPGNPLKLCAGDAIYVLASTQWAEKHIDFNALDSPDDMVTVTAQEEVIKEEADDDARRGTEIQLGDVYDAGDKAVASKKMNPLQLGDANDVDQ